MVISRESVRGLKGGVAVTWEWDILDVWLDIIVWEWGVGRICGHMG